MNDLIQSAQELLKSIKGNRLERRARANLSATLADILLQITKAEQSKKEKNKENIYHKITQDIQTKAFFLNLNDQCFRSKSIKRSIDQINYLLFQFGIPKQIPFYYKSLLLIFKISSMPIKFFLFLHIRKKIKKLLTYFIIPSERSFLLKHIETRKKEGFDLNINHIGDLFAGDKTNLYLHDLEHPKIDIISIKISKISSPIDFINWDESLKKTVENLKLIYRAALKNRKFVNIDMDEYKYLYFTIEAFKQALSEEEFLPLSAGIVLQSYFPDSFEIQKELTSFACERVKKGGSPIKICIAKGAYLGLEQVEASKNGWKLACFTSKIETDANFKRMLEFAAQHTDVVKLGIGTTNLFEIAYALILKEELEIDTATTFEILEGRFKYIARTLQKFAGNKIILFCPIASNHEFTEAIAYFSRRLEESSGHENFLKHMNELEPGSKYWEELKALFLQSCDEIENLTSLPRKITPQKKDFPFVFENEPKRDFSTKNHPKILLQNLILKAREEMPSLPVPWQASLEERCNSMSKAIELFREKREQLIAAIMLDSKKSLLQADEEVNLAIDSMEYHIHRIKKISAIKELKWMAKGVILVINEKESVLFKSIDIISAVLITGNGLIFSSQNIPEWTEKSASGLARKLSQCEDRKLVDIDLISTNLRSSPCEVLAPPRGATIQQIEEILLQASVPKEIFSFCSSPEKFIKNISMIYFAGKSEKAKKLIGQYPFTEIKAECEGKNSMIITALSDRTLALHDLIYSIDNNSCHFALLEKEIYEDKEFTKPLKNFEIVKADNLNHAIEIANSTPYGLSAGLHSLDPREQLEWMRKIEAGNLFINRDMVSTLIYRQPFGGCKESSFGSTFKSGGPNFLKMFLNTSQQLLPKERAPANKQVTDLNAFLEKMELSGEEKELWFASISNYAYWWRKMSQPRDPSRIIGEDNFLSYVPKAQITLRLDEKSSNFDALRICAAAFTIPFPLEISINNTERFEWVDLIQSLWVTKETDKDFLQRVESGKIKNLRLTNKASFIVKKAAAKSFCSISDEPVLANGRYELLNYLREVAVSNNYHRYGHLGIRESELRKLTI